MNLFDLYAKIALDKGEYDKGIDDASKTGKSFASSLSENIKKGVSGLAKGAAALITGASGAIVALGKIGLDYNSQMESYTTNFTTMLGSQEAAVQKVDELKKFAASTPLSMDGLAKGTQTLLAFGVASDKSTERLRQLGDISLGNADKMQSLATAFGKATAAGKVTGDTVQMMIDAGWNPLIQVSKAAGETMEETQKRMAAGKISVEELEAAMQAVTTGTGQFAGGMEAASHTTQGLISTLQDNARALVGEVFMPISEGMLSTLLPAALRGVEGLTTSFREKGISGMIDAAGQMLAKALSTITGYAPKLVNTAVSLVQSFLKGIRDNLKNVSESASNLVKTLIDGIIKLLPDILATGTQLVASIVSGLVKQLPDIAKSALSLIDTLVDNLIRNLPKILESGVKMVTSLITGIANNLPQVLQKAAEIVLKLAAGIIQNLPQILQAGGRIIASIISGIGQYWSNLISVADEIVSKIWRSITNTNWLELGKNIIRGLINGIGSMGSALMDAAKNVANSALNSIKRFFGIRSPSRVMRDQVGKMVGLGMAKGIEDEYSDVKKAMDGMYDIASPTVQTGLSVLVPSAMASSKDDGNSLNGAVFNISINGAKYSDERSLAQAVALELQNLVNRRQAVYA